MSGVHHFTSHSIGLPSSWPTPDSQSVPFHQPIPPLIMTSRSSGGFSVVASWISISSFFMSLFQFTFLWPNQSPEPTGVGACSCSGSRRLFHIFWSPAAQLFSLDAKRTLHVLEQQLCGVWRATDRPVKCEVGGTVGQPDSQHFLSVYQGAVFFYQDVVFHRPHSVFGVQFVEFSFESSRKFYRHKYAVTCCR